MSEAASSRRSRSVIPATLPPADVPAVRSAADDQPTVISRGAPPETDGLGLEPARIGPGQRLGHFELLEYVGGGGMGRVFRALDHRLSRVVALKILLPEQASDTETLLRFHNEARSAAKLDHENIVRVYYVGEDRGLPFIVFEFVEGANIRALVEQHGPLPLAEAIGYTLQVAEALAHAASRDVVHRDIKPSNILVMADGRAKLIDLGLARLQVLGAGGGDLTASGVTLGTFDYISPEQARDPRSVDVRSDIYSLGCTFFYMLAGQPPFPDGTVLQKLLQHQGDQPPDVREFRPELPEEVSRVLRRMLAKDPRHRYQHPGDLVTDLLVLAEHLGLRPVHPLSHVWAVPPPRQIGFWERHLPWMGPVAALLCIVLALDFLWGPTTAELAAVSPPGSLSANAGRTATEGEPPTSGSPQPADEGELGPAAVEAPVPAVVPATEPVAAAPRPASPASPPTTTESRPLASPAPAEIAPPPSKAVPPAPAAESAPTKGALRGETSQGELTLAQAGVHGITAADGTATLLAGSAVPREAPLPAAATPAAPARSGVLVVTAQPQGEREYGTLAAAVATATSGDVIELRYDGVREEHPVVLQNLRVTVRAGAGYAPTVRFRPNEMDPVRYRRGMLTLSAGRLHLIDVDLELELPREVSAENWSLFDLEGEESVRLEHCTLTVRNASDQGKSYHQDVAFFRTAPPEILAADGTLRPTQVAAVELVDCVARGEAVFLRAHPLQAVRLVWDNGLLATSERLLVAEGNAVTPMAADLIQAELRHLTLALGEGLCLMETAPAAPHPRAVQIYCADSILRGSGTAALVEHVYLDRESLARQQFTWSGDRNFYEGWNVFWRLRHYDPEVKATDWGRDEWQSHWGMEAENLPTVARVQWQQLPPAQLPNHAHRPEDYRLSPATENPARAAASDGLDAGLRLPRLVPPLPTLPPAS